MGSRHSQTHKTQGERANAQLHSHILEVNDFQGHLGARLLVYPVCMYVREVVGMRLGCEVKVTCRLMIPQDACNTRTQAEGTAQVHVGVSECKQVCVRTHPRNTSP